MATTDSGHSRGRRGIASRAAHWSAEHRKTAIFGFIAFAIVAFMAGQSIGTNQLTDLDQFTGETHRAEQARDDAGLRPVEEVVLVQSDELTIVHEADREGQWIRLKVCPADDCQWAFYDRSRNRSATWCDMKVCGNRHKVREYRERRLRGATQ